MHLLCRVHAAIFAANQGHRVDAVAQRESAMLRGTSSRTSRRAVTLVEILLVLVILVILAAAVAPSFYRTVRDAKLRSAGEQVRTEWNKAHIKAMKNGRIYVFRFQPGGRKFQVEPYMAEDVTSDAASTSTFAPPPAPPQRGGVKLQLSLSLSGRG